MYIIGGYREKQYTKEPSSVIYKVDVSEFNKTKVNRSKKNDIKLNDKKIAHLFILYSKSIT